MVNNIKIGKKLRTIMIGNIILLALCCIIIGLSQYIQSNEMFSKVGTIFRENHDLALKEQVETVISAVEYIYDEYKSGKYTEDEAKEKAANMVRELRYGVGGYFWIDDFDGNNIVILGNKEIEGTNSMML